jgi:hypothetical protein
VTNGRIAERLIGRGCRRLVTILYTGSTEKNAGALRTCSLETKTDMRVGITGLLDLFHIPVF